MTIKHAKMACKHDCLISLLPAQAIAFILGPSKSNTERTTVCVLRISVS